MKTLLRIDSSLRTEGSQSKTLADFFVKQWKEVNPNGNVIHRDLTKQNMPHLSQETVTAFYIPENDISETHKTALAFSNALIAELKSADDILISSPLYNLNVPSKLKAYLDHVIRSGVTFKVDTDGSYVGLLKDKSAYAITTKGAVYKGTPMESLDFQEPYLKTILGFLGIELKALFSLEGTAHPDISENNLKIQQDNILNTFKSFAL
ncbi:FMN-dependent NADH-azoreductase [Seonamhaeicola marinus]|uniref:FMN dependent NADH:quinone oxidoreductase n=1 Tax=Seonamhaeicola marinus TaxID=1912246 RepID=A0A5D0IM64_9FLAO|nr:NAD(P)H-dependent oxidoreductase [Seonamhaeicola marinus]TYA84091.1 FMN-dependent NADH-azoreductase [Seonamhaeicola marinus]